MKGVEPGLYIAAHETRHLTDCATAPCCDSVIILLQKTIEGWLKQAQMTHFKEGLAPVTPEARAVDKKQKGASSPAPLVAEQGESWKTHHCPQGQSDCDKIGFHCYSHFRIYRLALARLQLLMRTTASHKLCQ